MERSNVRKSAVESGRKEDEKMCGAGREPAGESAIEQDETGWRNRVKKMRRIYAGIKKRKSM